MPRLFAGLTLPEDVRLGLAMLKMPLPGAKWIEPENLHITIRFAGDISNIEAREFADALSRISLPAFNVSVRDLGAFGGNEPRVLWAGVDGGEGLERLFRACDRAARTAGLAPEPRSFKPHVTLARLKNSRPEAVARFLTRRSTISFRPFLADHFVLFSSRPNLGGGPYVVEEEFSLQSGTAGLWAPDPA
jgi:2'-5' RNA ligase